MHLHLGRPPVHLLVVSRDAGQLGLDGCFWASQINVQYSEFMSFANAFGLNAGSKTLYKLDVRSTRSYRELCVRAGWLVREPVNYSKQHELRKVSIVLSIRGLRVTPITAIRIQMWQIEVVAQIVSRVETTRPDQT